MSKLPEQSDFFIEPEKEEPTPIPPKKTTTKTKSKQNIWWVIFTSILYGVIAIAVAISVRMTGGTILTVLTFYLYAIISGLAFVLIKKIYTESEKGRQILVEALEYSRGARLITDSDENIIYKNSTFDELFEIQDISSIHDILAIFSDTDELKNELEKIKDIEKTSISRKLSSIKNDHTYWYEITIQTISGWPNYFHWRIDDVTMRKMRDDKRKAEWKQLTDLTSKAPVGFFSVDVDGNFLFINKTLADWLGKTPRELIGKRKLHEFLVTPPNSGQSYDCLSDGGDYQHGEVKIKGHNRTINAIITHSIVHEDDNSVRTRSIVYDLTSEQKMKQALKESEERFRHLFAEAPLGVCLLHKDGKLDECNQSFAQMVSQELPSLKGRTMESLVEQEYKTKTKDWINRILIDEKAYSSIEVLFKGEKERVAQLYAMKFESGNKTVLYCVDLTEQKNLEKQFNQSQKMQAVGQLAGGIAHDFNNLLTAMIGFCDLLLLRHKPGDPSFGDITQIKQNANRASNLVRQLLAFSRQQTLQPQVLDVADVLTELTHLIRRLIGVNIELNIDHGTDIGLIKADQGQLEQVLINLAVNARDAMPNGGNLTFRTKMHSNAETQTLIGDEILPPGEWVVTEVEDTGTGIDPENLERIFEPFFSTKEVGAGTGLGLATVHGIVHQTGGALGLTSSLGKGTTFSVYLPIYIEDKNKKDKEIEHKGVDTSISDLTGSAKILLVEDEDAVRTFSTRALSNKGYDVLDAECGESALELIEKEKPELELLITDVIMPNIDGPTMAKEIRKKYPDLKIIFMSGYTEDKFKDQFEEGTYFLQKPFTLKQLATKVKEVLQA